MLRNIERDDKINSQLHSLGWTVFKDSVSMPQPRSAYS